MGWSIPKVIRPRLFEMASEIERGEYDMEDIADELRELAEQTKRNPAVGYTRPKNRTMTPVLGRQVRAYKRLHPDKSHAEIGLIFRVNSGRVSEALNGRHADPLVEAVGDVP